MISFRPLLMTTFTAEIGSRGHRLDLGIGYRF